MTDEELQELCRRIRRNSDAMSSEIALDVALLLAEVARLRAIEAAALAQSEDVQVNWLSPVEAAGLRAEVEALQTQVDDLADLNCELQAKRAENARLRAALQEIVDDGEFVPAWDFGRKMDITVAKQALGIA